MDKNRINDRFDSLITRGILLLETKKQPLIIGIDTTKNDYTVQSVFFCKWKVEVKLFLQRLFKSNNVFLKEFDFNVKENKVGDTKKGIEILKSAKDDFNEEPLDIDRQVEKKEIRVLQNQKKKIQVFISSTYKLMEAERQAAVGAVLQAGHIPAGMELFTANDESQWKTIQKWIQDSDTFMLIVGGRYGSIYKRHGRSYVELEYNYAKKLKKKPFTLLMDKEYVAIKTSENKDFEEKDNVKLYKNFKKKLLDSKLCAYFSNIDGLKFKILTILKEYENNPQFQGWIKAPVQTTKEIKTVDSITKKTFDVEAFKKLNEQSSFDPDLISTKKT